MSASGGHRLARHLGWLGRADVQQETWLAAVAPDAAPARVDLEDATRAAQNLAQAYWSLWRLFVQAVAFAVVGLALLFCTTSVGVLLSSPESDAGALVVFIIGMALFSAWMAWMMVRTAHTADRIGAGAVAWAAIAGRRGAAVDISGGWRRWVRVAFGIVGALLSACALLIAVSAGFAPELGMATSYIVFLVAVGAAGGALSLVLLVRALRGLR